MLCLDEYTFKYFMFKTLALVVLLIATSSAMAQTIRSTLFIMVKQTSTMLSLANLTAASAPIGMGGADFESLQADLDVAGVKGLVLVPYKDVGFAVRDFSSDFVAGVAVPLSIAQSMAANKSAKPIAVVATQRHAAFPDVPTLSESMRK